MHGRSTSKWDEIAWARLNDAHKSLLQMKLDRCESIGSRMEWTVIAVYPLARPMRSTELCKKCKHHIPACWPRRKMYAKRARVHVFFVLKVKRKPNAVDNKHNACILMDNSSTACVTCDMNNVAFYACDCSGWWLAHRKHSCYCQWIHRTKSRQHFPFFEFCMAKLCHTARRMLTEYHIGN